MPRDIRKQNYGQKAKKGTFGRLLKYVWEDYGFRLVIVLICVLFTGVANVIASVFLQRIIDECITPGLTEGLSSVIGTLTHMIITMALIYAFGVLSAFIQARLMATITQGTLKKLRVKMFEKMETLPIRYFDTHAHGDIMSTYTNDTDTVRQLIGMSLPQVITSSLSIVATFSMMLYYSLWMTLAVIVFLFVMLQVTRKFGGASAKYMMAQQKSLAACEGYIEEMMNGLKVVKVFNREDACREEFDRLNEQLFHDGNEAHRNGNILMPILANLGNLMYVLLAVFGVVLIYAGATNVGFSGMGQITAGIIITFLGCCRSLSQTIGQISMQVPQVAMALAGAERVFNLIDEESEKDEGYVTLVNAKKDENGVLTETEEVTGIWAWKHPHKAEGTVSYQELKGDIVLDMVDFGYTQEKQVLTDISLYAKPGQKIAFVGATGAGKTTITNLINRFYDIEDGKIRYDGININKIKKPDLRRSLGIVLQDVNLFTGSVMDNIRYGKLDATDEECIAAAKLANADDFITRLPDGYGTMLTGNGASLSQGQRQLLSIARAAVANPPVMILDEATSSIDTRTEALVQRGMDNLMKGRTVFVIAHRLSTIRNSEAIMVLDAGRIIERGNHEELLAMKGTYYQLYTGAFELE